MKKNWMTRLLLLLLAVCLAVGCLTACEQNRDRDEDEDDDKKGSSSVRPTVGTNAPGLNNGGIGGGTGGELDFGGIDQGAVSFDELDLSAVDLNKVSVSAEPTDYVRIRVESYGDIIIRLFPQVAPITVANFKNLVAQQFYDGILFHRVIEGFMIQGGDPEGTGFGGSDVTIKGEFSSNGVENPLKHIRGTVSMARTYVPDSASSQFFICQATYAYGDGQYAAFGYVVSGMDVVDRIAAVDTNSSNKPLTDVVMTSVRFVKIDE